jgi:hypothetical protein
MYSYINRYFVPRVRQEDEDSYFSMFVAESAMVVWRDVVLRSCIDRLVQDAAAGGSADHAAELLESSTKRMFFDSKGNQLAVDVATLFELQQRLEAEPIMFEALLRPGWTKRSHHSCSDGTRNAVTTLLLVRQRLKVRPEGVADIPRESLFDTWWQIAKFLPVQW